MRAIQDIEEGTELVRIPRKATIHQSPLISPIFKKYPEIKRNREICVILSLMAEWGREGLKFKQIYKYLLIMFELKILIIDRQIYFLINILLERYIR